MLRIIWGPGNSSVSSILIKKGLKNVSAYAFNHPLNKHRRDSATPWFNSLSTLFLILKIDLHVPLLDLIRYSIVHYLLDHFQKLKVKRIWVLCKAMLILLRSLNTNARCLDPCYRTGPESIHVLPTTPSTHRYATARQYDCLTAHSV